MFRKSIIAMMFAASVSGVNAFTSSDNIAASAFSAATHLPVLPADSTYDGFLVYFDEGVDAESAIAEIEFDSGVEVLIRNKSDDRYLLDIKLPKAVDRASYYYNRKSLNDFWRTVQTNENVKVAEVNARAFTATAADIVNGKAETITRNYSVLPAPHTYEGFIISIENDVNLNQFLAEIEEKVGVEISVRRSVLNGEFFLIDVVLPEALDRASYYYNRKASFDFWAELTHKEGIISAEPNLVNFTATTW